MRSINWKMLDAIKVVIIAFYYIHTYLIYLISVQSLSSIRLFATPSTAACQASLSITNSWSLLRLMSFESEMPSNHLILCHPLLLLPSIFPSIRVFSSESVLHISPSNEYSGLISFRMDWLDLPAVQGTLKSLLQHHNSKASFLRGLAFFIVQLSHPYMTTGKTIALTFEYQINRTWICVSMQGRKVMTMRTLTISRGTE